MSDTSEDLLTRSLPCNIKAEQMLLGAVLINSELIYRVNEFLKAEHFFNILHQKIYEAIEIIIEKNIVATPVTLKNMLDRHQAFQEAGGSEYLNKLTTLSLTVINPYDYGRIVYDLAIKRNLIQIGSDIVNDAYDSSFEYEAKQQIENAESKLFHLASEGVNERGFAKIQKSVTESLEIINRAIKNSDNVTGISTGLIDLDKKLSGFHNSDLVILAARPSMGKTAFAINFALNACSALANQSKEQEQVKSVGFFSLEMSSEQLTTRLLAMLSGINSSDLRLGRVNAEQYNDLRQAASKLSELPFFLDDTPALSISAIRTRARKLKRKHNLGILFIDYLQLIKVNNGRDNRVLEISEITQGLKAIAKELNIPVIALSQLSRAVEQRDDKRPMLSDLRESGSIEQDADVVMFIYREEYYLSRKQPADSDPKYAQWCIDLEKVYNITELIVAKHRNGPIGNVSVFYDTSRSTIKDLSQR